LNEVPSMRAFILAAGRGARLSPLTTEIPKCLLPLAEGVTILDSALDALVAQGVNEVAVVSGHGHDALARHLGAAWPPPRLSATVLYNERYDTADNIVSLARCRAALPDGEGFLLLNSDVVFHPVILERLLAAEGAALAVDERAALGAEEMKVRVGGGGRIVAISKYLDPASSRGEYIGLAKFTAPAARALLSAIERWVAAGRVRAYYEDALHDVLGEVEVGVVPTDGAGWVEVDTPGDLNAARALYRSLRGERRERGAWRAPDQRS